MAIEDVERYIERGNEKLDVENYTEALKFANKALEIDSDNIGTNFLKGDILYELNDLENALKSYDNVKKISILKILMHIMVKH